MTPRRPPEQHVSLDREQHEQLLERALIARRVRGRRITIKQMVAEALNAYLAVPEVALDDADRATKDAGDTSKSGSKR
jgi:hypothetical protein